MSAKRGKVLDTRVERCGRADCMCSGPGPHSLCKTSARIDAERRAFLLSFSDRKPRRSKRKEARKTT